MRTSKAYIAGAGTTSVLVASAVLLLAVVSTLVAFNGWPGTGLTEDIGNLVVDEPERLPVDEPVQVALNASSAAAAVASVPAPGSAAAGGSAVAPTGSAGALLPSGITPAAGGDGGGGGGGDPQLRNDPLPLPEPPAQEPGGLLPETPVSGEVRRLTGGLGDTTQGLTDNLGNTVGQLNPGLGQVLINTGRSLAELLRDLGRPRR